MLASLFFPLASVHMTLTSANKGSDDEVEQVHHLWDVLEDNCKRMPYEDVCTARRKDNGSEENEGRTVENQ